MALHYVTLHVDDLERSGRFYDSLLAPLGWRRFTGANENGFIGWGITRKAEFYVAVDDGRGAKPGYGQVSFPANSIPAAKASYEAGMQNGGESLSEPGSRPSYGGGTYSARLTDPDGYAVEIAVAPE